MRYLLLFFLFSPYAINAQNLVVNGSFEEENLCTEYKKYCAPEGWLVSSGKGDAYFINLKQAKEGTHYMGVEAGFLRWMSDRSFIRSQLLCKLRKGNRYRIEFYVKSKYPLLDSVGVYFTQKDFLFDVKPERLRVASVYAVDGNFDLKNDEIWKKVELIYTSIGDEAFITIGSFARQHSLEKVKDFREKHMLIFFDNISVFPIDPNENLCADWKKTKEEIYNFDIRHDYLSRYLETYSEDPPIPEMSRTITHVIDTLIIPDILFETGKSALNKKSHHFIDSISQIIRRKLIDSIVIEGHTDSVGTIGFNQKLSMDRANNVHAYLIQNIKAPFITRGWASQKPVADNRTPEGRQRNRRVEVYLYVREEE